MMHKKLKFLVLIILAFLISACAITPNKVWHNMQAEGKTKKFESINIEANGFKFAGLIKDETNKNSILDKNLTIYIEGDGLAFKNNMPSEDPSPRNPQAYYLAIQDSNSLVCYLARIGQYNPSQTGDRYKVYWSGKRLAPEVIEATSAAIDKIKKQTGAKNISLVGYSGGGGVAALVAARRSDVVQLITVAGLLDVDWWVKTKKLKPLEGSLNPADYAENLVHLKQIHFYGLSDKVIQAEMSSNFKRKANFTNIRLVPVKSDHWNNWTKLWPSLLGDYVF